MKTIAMMLLLPLLALVNAYGQEVRYNFSSGTDFAKYKTYQWVEIKGGDQPDQLTDEQLKQAIDAELAKKGLIKTDRNPDLLVGYQASVRQEKQLSIYNSGWGYGPGWGYGWYGGAGGFTTAETTTIVTGQLDLDIYDAAQQKLIWRGTASKTLDADAKPDKRQKNIVKGVAKLLKNYPPPAKNG